MPSDQTAVWRFRDAADRSSGGLQTRRLCPTLTAHQRKAAALPEPLKFALAIRGQFAAGYDMAKALEELLAQCRLARQLGFAGIAKSQHYSSAPFQEIQQLPFLARAAAEVPGLDIITGISLLPLHKPLDLAEQLAALDLISGGKLIYGCGIGYREVEFNAFGTTQSERVSRFVENLDAIRRLWREPSVTMTGSHFTLDRASCSVKPLQPGGPPVWIGADADAAIRRAARLGDAWMINPHVRVDTLIRQMDIYKQALDKNGKQFPKTQPLIREMYVASSRAEAMRRARPYLEAKYKAYHAWGQDDDMPDGDNDLSAAYEDMARDRFIFGGFDEAAEQLATVARACGANYLLAPIQWPGMPQSEALEQMHVLMEEVKPRVEAALR